MPDAFQGMRSPALIYFRASRESEPSLRRAGLKPRDVVEGFCRFCEGCALGEPNWDELPAKFQEPVRKLRQAAGEGSVSIITNGKGLRHWSVERWLAVGTFAFAAVSSSAAGLFFVGGEYHRISESIRVLPELTKAVSEVPPQISEIRAEQRAMQRQLNEIEEASSPGRPRLSPAAADRIEPAYPRDERFVVEPNP